MATAKEWLNQKFIEWEKAQGRSQSYYAFARQLDVSQSSLAQWMNGTEVPAGDELLNLAKKLGPEIYEILGLPRPNTQVERVAVSFATLPPDIREKLTGAISEADQTIRRERVRPDSPEARKLVLDIFAKHGFRYTG